MIGYNKNEIIGKMRERVILQNRVINQSNSGFQIESYSNIGTYWTSLDYKTGFEEEDSDKIVTQQKINFTLRYNQEINTNSRLVYRDSLYQIEKIEISNDRRFVVCTGVYRSSYTGSYAISIGVASTVSGIATSTANIKLLMSVIGQANAIASAIADITVLHQSVVEVAAFAYASATTTADIKLSKTLVSSVNATGTTTADLTVTASASLLLDLYPSAAAAYSLRKLRTAYTGSAVRVRRSSDNTEQDIGFSGNNLDTTALTTFIGAGNGFVTTWYDQSGSGNNATMTTQANQPQIVSSGSVITHNSKPALQYDGTNDGLNAVVSGINNTSALCLFYVYSSNLAAAADTNSALLWYNGDFLVTNLRGHISSTGLLGGEYMALDVRTSITGGDRLGSTTYRRSANTVVVENNFYLTSGTSFQQNNNNVSLNLLTSGVTTSTNYTPNAYNTSTNLNIGYNISGVYANQKISEFIVYLSDQTTNRSNINGNINTEYAIY